MRTVIVRADDEGRSFIESDEEAPRAGQVWALDPMNDRNWPSMIEQTGDLSLSRFGPGIVKWYRTEFAPGRAIDFHTTNTVDLIYVLVGTLRLTLDLGSVDLHHGDFVVLYAANHGWKNPTDKTTWFLDVMISTVPANARGE